MTMIDKAEAGRNDAKEVAKLLAEFIDATLRRNTERDGNWGYPSFHDETRDILARLETIITKEERMSTTDAATEKGGDAFEDRDSDRPNPATSPGVTAGADAAQAREAAQEHRLIAAAKEARDIAIRHAAREG